MLAVFVDSQTKDNLTATYAAKANQQNAKKNQESLFTKQGLVTLLLSNYKIIIT